MVQKFKEGMISDSFAGNTDKHPLRSEPQSKTGGFGNWYRRKN